MIIYSPDNMIPERIKEAEKILETLPYRYCFITGTFLYNKNYKDIDVFAITRSKKKSVTEKGIKLSIIDFNELHSLFYHSISKMCVAKEVLPKKDLRATVADYWGIINETVPTLINEKENFRKAIRSLILYTEYLEHNKILDSFELRTMIHSFKTYEAVMEYIKVHAPIAIKNRAKEGYIKRFFYTQAGFHKQHIEYAGQKHLYDISHAIAQTA
jgi:hypothetical protein